MDDQARNGRGTQSAHKRLRRHPAKPIRDSGASRNQSPNVRVQSLPSSRHELRAWQTGGVHVRPFLQHVVAADPDEKDARGGLIRQSRMRMTPPRVNQAHPAQAQPCFITASRQAAVEISSFIPLLRGFELLTDSVIPAS